MNQQRTLFNLANLLVATCFIFGFSAHAKVQIQWYEPISNLAEPSKAMVLISGKVDPGTKVSVDFPNIRTDDGQTVIEKYGEDFLKANKAPRLKTKSNNRGLFALRFPMPLGTVMVPIKVEGESGEGNFLLQFKVEPEAVQIGTDDKVLEESPLVRKKFRLWLGLGMNYLNFQQNEPGVIEDINFNSLDGPIFLYQLSYWMTPNFDSSLSYISTRGQTKSSSTVDIEQGVYSWQTISGDIKHFPDFTKFYIGKRKMFLGYRVGAQYHILPFLERGASSSTRLFMKNMELYQASAGPVLKFKLSKAWVFETFMRFQYLVGSNSGLNLENGLSFDGSVGFKRRILDKFFMGIFWYGQTINADYDHKEPFLNETRAGELNLLYSNLEIRLGVSF